MNKRPLPPNTKRYSEQATNVFKGVRFEVYQWPQKQFDGSTATYEIVKRDDTVIILGVIGEEVILVKEQQPHWDKPGFTVPAGMVEKDEDLVVAARREMEEETGLIFKTYTLVHVEPPIPAVEWFAYTFIASDYEGEKPKKLDAGEKNEVVKISLDELVKMTRNKELFYRPRFIEDLLMQGKESELKEIIKNPTKYSLGNE